MYLCGNSFGISFANRRESNPHSLPSGSVFCPFSTMESHHRFSTTGSNIFFLTVTLTSIYETAYLKCCRSGGIRIPESPGCKPGAFNQLSYAPKNYTHISFMLSLASARVYLYLCSTNPLSPLSPPVCPIFWLMTPFSHDTHDNF